VRSRHMRSDGPKGTCEYEGKPFIVSQLVAGVTLISTEHKPQVCTGSRDSAATNSLGSSARLDTSSQSHRSKD
jgi:hypothetical protein